MDSVYEQTVSKDLANRGWLSVKLMRTNLNGIPDRMYLKDSQVFFIEFKSASGKLSELQKYRIEQLRINGFHVFVFYEKINNRNKRAQKGAK